MARGSYKGKVMFVDHDGIVHMQFEYYFDIAKEWKWIKNLFFNTLIIIIFLTLSILYWVFNLLDNIDRI